MRYVSRRSRSKGAIGVNKAAKLIAFHLPQFYPTPYNDEWWGKGFTEWTNVTKARPLFEGHYQPHLPADLGFYDLRLAESRAAQAELASAYGIYGFCYYHYWFSGKRVLERTVDEILKLRAPDFPFCFCWANENWTAGWDGGDKKILLQQIYSLEDDMNHIRWLCAAFSDPRYIRIDGKPLFLVYRTEMLPDPLATTERWRQEAMRLGIGDLYLCLVEGNSGAPLIDPANHGCDAAVAFQPKLTLMDESLVSRAMHRFHLNTGSYRLHLYSDMIDRVLAQPAAPYVRYPCVCPGWDNSSRHPRWPFILKDSTPELYERWLREAINGAPHDKDGHKIVFVNAWNEWAEGCHLEPCQKWGRKYLEANLRVTRDIEEEANRGGSNAKNSF